MTQVRFITTKSVYPQEELLTMISKLSFVTIIRKGGWLNLKNDQQDMAQHKTGLVLRSHICSRRG